MAAVTEHYATHLGPVYAWMAGGVEAAIARGAKEIETLGLLPRLTGQAVDLGAGFGMHSIPLARRGFSVLAIDSCGELLQTLRQEAGDLPIRTVEGDLLAFGRHLDGLSEIVLCMGDTLTHLPDFATVNALFDSAARQLCAGGKLVLTFRDYSTPLRGEQRFIPVRSDAGRILTCVLEYEDQHVVVQDLLHEFDGTVWRQRVSSYRKLRIEPSMVVAALESLGFTVQRSAGVAGMICLVASI
ncbi:MAG TPA: methyltransferase domain-containing protein [Steroidobacteraceae bacterium]|jgi:SAM-dependent methyltransferase|nr:methyltransferase domain-containing protein [Steroidobacteraceae bacterium]